MDQIDHGKHTKWDITIFLPVVGSFLRPLQFANNHLYFYRKPQNLSAQII